MQVWRYRLPTTDRFTIRMPAGARLLHVDAKHDAEPNVWALVDLAAEYVDRLFRLAGSGHKIEEEECETYVGTFLLAGGSLVFHLFDLGEIGPDSRGA